ncbi:two-partner secretion domain-containing protein [Ramlibacter sp. AN1133]|uniref:two-partner secretion domain-containing protein n=1 Tax=Ramlibacter sp. AN1133 TaxID=3133429 RepID=UPI0030BE8169
MNKRFLPGTRPPHALAVLALMMFSFEAAHAAPVGGAVAAGAAGIATTGASTTITQTTPSAVINWQGFGIAAGESVRFQQPASSSVMLNRVVGPDPSAIFGSLSANGKVFLVNPGGVLFGPGASVNVGGLVASTLDIADGDFMAGRYSFSGSGRGAVVNQGTINADGGYVALLGTDVANQGVISARLGSVALAAGQAITLDVVGDNLLNVAVDRGAVDALVSNGGLIQADGGRVLMTTQSAGNLLSTAVNNTGVIQARTISSRDGSIMLLGDMQSGTVSAGGTLDVSAAGAGQVGGSVTLTAHNVGLFGAYVDASGAGGGGTVLVGGDYQGRNAGVPNATAAYMSADSTITASATIDGSGGKVVIWSNESTRAYGSITARGGPQGGDGGQVETSGGWLDVAGIHVDAGASAGTRGMWLLDPADITIGLGATTGATVTGGVFAPNSGVSTATIAVADLTTALGVGAAGTDVTITTTNRGAAGSGAGNITIATPLSWSPTTPTTLTLNAAGDVNINAAVTTTRGNLVVCCGNDVNVNAPIVTTNGSVLLSAGRDVNIVRDLLHPTAGLTTTTGNIMLCAARDINLTNTANGAALIVLTTGSATAGESLANLGVPRGLSLRSGTGSTGPGAANGTVKFGVGAYATVTGPAGIAPIDIVYNPTSYLTPTDYTGFFATGNGGPFTSRMLVHPAVPDRFENGTSVATLTGLQGSPSGVTLVAGPLATASFADGAPGTGKTVIYSGYTVSDPANFALPVSCCAPIQSTTTGTIKAAAVVPPVVVPPVVIPPAVVPPVVIPPVVVIPPIPIAPTPIPPVPIAPVLLPEVEVPIATSDTVLPQFAPFIVAPLLLRPPSPLLVVSPVAPPPMQLVLVQPPVPAPVVAPAAVRAPEAAPAPAAQPAPPAPAPYVAPPRPARPYRN